jgi:hypothetical protein
MLPSLAQSSPRADSALTCKNDRKSSPRQRALPGCCDNFLYYFKGTPPARQAVRPQPRSDAETREHRGVARAGHENRANSRTGRPGTAPTPGGRPAAPCRAGALWARSRHQVGRPAPAGRQFPQQRASRCTATARTGWTVLLAPDILSPRKDHRLGRAQGRVPSGWRKRHPRH